MPGRGNRRKTGLEQYYTPDETARELVNAVLEHTDAGNGDRWLEPAAGCGAFTRAMRAAGMRRVVSLDIEPKRHYVKRHDFLADELDLTGAVCVTNPPFGRNHALSIPFFNRAAQHCRIIGFVVPRSWRKWSVINRLDRSFCKVYDADLSVAYVDENGEKLSKSSVLNTVFQIWVRNDTPRPTFPVGGTTTRFTVVKPSEADASITVFGRGCGTVRTDFPRTAKTTQMYVKADDEVIDALGRIDLSPFYRQVAYTEALSAVEINYALDHWFTHHSQLDADFLRHSTLQKPG